MCVEFSTFLGIAVCGRARAGLRTGFGSFALLVLARARPATSGMAALVALRLSVSCLCGGSQQRGVDIFIHRLHTRGRAILPEVPQKYDIGHTPSVANISVQNSPYSDH